MDAAGPRFEDITLEIPVGAFSAFDWLLNIDLDSVVAALHEKQKALAAPNAFVLAIAGASAAFYLVHRVVVRARAKRLHAKHTRMKYM